MENAPANCIVCGGSHRTPMIQLGEWTVRRCRECGLGLLDPRPDEAELKDLYDSHYFDSHYREELEIGSPQMKRRLRQEDHRIRFFRRYKRKGRILDIGCGRGYFLLACRESGYEVEGVDISEDAAAYVRDRLSIPVAAGKIGDINLERKRYDVITMWHSLEHMPDPGACLDRVRDWLKDDGVAVVDVPNHEGTDAKSAWTEWADWDLPYHFYHFTPGTLKGILVKHGFSPVRQKTYHSEFVKKKLERIPVVGLCSRLIAGCYSGNSVAMVARKLAAPCTG